MSLLDRIHRPGDVAELSAVELPLLAAEIREFLVEQVSSTGGHLGPNLGVVELTIALHRVFRSPEDVILWDTGHQAYVHKLLTGRRDGFANLRRRGGMSGYPSRTESEHDFIENSHASTAMSYADGLARGRRLRGEVSRSVVAVVGDGALTGGMAWEAVNNIAAEDDLPLVIVVNDNGRSYAPTVGGLAGHLTALRTSRKYDRFLNRAKKLFSSVPLVYRVLHGVKKGMKDALVGGGLFEDIGLKYVGPVDGHDVAAVESALRHAVSFRGPVIVHCLTRKGCGHPAAEADARDRFHTVAAPGPRTGQSWTSVFGEEMVRLAESREDVVAITAAMLEPTGLAPMAARFPDRVFDVGIAEQHAVTSAAGLALAGLRPVVAVYSTFLNRAFDQVLMDVALHSLPVTFVLDRAGITGDDGASHNGMWDLALFGLVPELRIAAPRDAGALRTLLGEAVALDDGPALVRFPKGEAGPDVPATGRVDGLDVLHTAPGADVLIISVGALARTCVEVAENLAGRGIAATVVDPGWIKPVPAALVALADRHRLVATVEDGLVRGGFGEALAPRLRTGRLVSFGVPQRFLAHGKRAEVLAECGLNASAIEDELAARLTELDDDLRRDRDIGAACCLEPLNRR